MVVIWIRACYLKFLITGRTEMPSHRTPMDHREGTIVDHTQVAGDDAARNDLTNTGPARMTPWRPALPLQPRPTGFVCETLGEAGREVTVIVRSWHPAQIRACRLCDECTANERGSFCALKVPGRMAPRDALMYGIRSDGPELIAAVAGPAHQATPLRIAQTMATDGPD